MNAPIDFTKEATYAQTRLPVSLASTLEPEAYRRKDFYELELKKLWEKSWICVGYTQQITNVGDTFVVRIGDQSLIITRSAPDAVRGFYNVCRHRGTEMLKCDGNHKFFRCPYHAWGYDLNGTLLGTPYFKDDEEISPEVRKIYDSSGAQAFDKKNYGLLPVKLETWGCFIFVNLDGKCEPLAKQLGDIVERAKRYPFKDLVKSHTAHYTIESNWKLVAENFMEYYHLPTVHPDLNKVSHLTNHFPYQGEGMYYGMTTSPLEKDPTVPIGRELPHMPGLDDVEDVSARWYWLFPNFSISLLPDYMIVMKLVPDGPHRTRETYDYFFHPVTRAASNFKEASQAIFEFWDAVNKEDINIVEAVQRGLNNEAYRGGRMCFRFEDNIHRFQNHVIDKMVG